MLKAATPGLYWIAVLFSGLLALQRSSTVESADGNRDALRLSGLEPGGIYLGKTLAVAVQLLVLEVVLGVGVALLYNTTFGRLAGARRHRGGRDRGHRGRRYPLRRRGRRAPSS